MARSFSKMLRSVVRHKCVTATALSMAVAMGSGMVHADPYAPLADYASVPDQEKKTNPFVQILQHAKVPDAAEVGVAQYPNARIVAVLASTRASGDRSQVIRDLRLYTADPINQVADYFKEKQSVWVWRDNGGSTAAVPLVRGASSEQDLQDSKQVLLGGPRILLTALDQPDQPANSVTQRLLAIAPGSRTEIRIEYPGKTTELIHVSTALLDQAIKSCEADQAKNFSKVGKLKLPEGASEEERAKAISEYAKQACSVVRRRCSERPKGYLCQTLLRRYGQST